MMTPDELMPDGAASFGDDNQIDDELRTALAALDPAAADPTAETADALNEAWSQVQTRMDPERDDEASNTDDQATAKGQAGTPPVPRRRWWELAAAACLGAALVGGAVVAGGTFSGGADAGVVAGISDDSAVSSTEPYAGAPVDGAAADRAQGDVATSTDSSTAASSTLARSASATVATDNPQSARDSYVATITGLGGRVTSETTTTAGGNGPVEPMPADVAIYPPIYSGAGVFLDVEVPATAYDEAVAAIAPLGEVIELSQSAYDTGTSIAEGEARISALQDSLTRLQALLSQANSVGEVIELENAITTRQSELDALTAQQRYLTDQVEQARISLRLVTSADADDLYDPGPDSWWESLTSGLAQAWMWLGRALAWTSPLWIGGLLWWLLHRRRTGQATGSDAPDSNRRQAAPRP